ncbi:metalloregulator ArsR/SmtB family transcription factor [Cryobacterium sp. PH29-G1]|uniref:ArsR/SmtB family transcription factor n=1 Tax=Cryobacterium sp. PH29-G1 TaxID=3046211 RepID=UPI0024BB2B59|nr:metalloregulator ArsR/SmtB family transcription factor [Cryobacterium sp. PH29-G1]MDJ0350098.1 metalloregulator ArsR/SmtB family transcription factor [Cryobacterium sp. PH29-G1]
MTFTRALPLADISPGAPAGTDQADAVACSSSMARAAIAPEHADALARSIKALADPARLRILSIVSAHADQEACVCDLTDQLTLSQPTISHHLKVLVEAGFLLRAKRGTWSYYSLVPGSLDSVAGVLVAI